MGNEMNRNTFGSAFSPAPFQAGLPRCLARRLSRCLVFKRGTRSLRRPFHGVSITLILII